MQICPICGYNEARANIRQSNVMNHYVNKATGKSPSVFNHEADEFTIGEGKDAVTYIKRELYKESTPEPSPVADVANKPIVKPSTSYIKSK